MAIKPQGSEFNRTLTTVFDPADFGAFNFAQTAVVLRGDASRRLFITGLSFSFRVGAPADTDPNNSILCGLFEGMAVNPDSNISPLPEQQNALSFFFEKPAPDFTNSIREHLTAPFELSSGVTYSVVGIVSMFFASTISMVARLTVFGYERRPDEGRYYEYPR